MLYEIALLLFLGWKAYTSLGSLAAELGITGLIIPAHSHFLERKFHSKIVLSSPEVMTLFSGIKSSPPIEPSQWLFKKVTSLFAGSR